MLDGIKQMIIKLIIKWILLALIVFLITWLIPGIAVDGFGTIFLAAGLIALINIFIKPILKIITLPINMMSMGIFALILNAFLFWLVSYFVPGFTIDGVMSACLGSIVLSLLSVVLNFV